MCQSEGYPYGKAARERFSAATSLILLEYLGQACPPDALHAVQMYSPTVADLSGGTLCASWHKQHARLRSACQQGATTSS